MSYSINSVMFQLVYLPWSPTQSFTAGVQPDGNVCRAELNVVEVAQARSAAVAVTKVVCRSFS